MKFSDLVAKPKVENSDTEIATKLLQMQKSNTTAVKTPVVKATKKNLKQYSIMDILRASNIKIKNITPDNNAVSIELYSIPDNIDIILRDLNYTIVGNSIIVDID